MPSTSSETPVHFVAIMLAVTVLAGTSWAVNAYELSDAVFAAANVVFNAIVFGGAHLYLAVRGEGGSVPVASRWRFIGFLGVVAAVALAGIAFGDAVEATVGASVRTLGVGFVLVAAFTYLVVEARAGYHDAMTGEA